MTRLFLEETIHPGQSLCLTGEKAHYLSVVLRCKLKDELFVTDSSGAVYSAEISAVGKKQVTLNIRGLFSQNNESSLEIVLLQGLLKGEKMDLVVQKTVELGVTEIIPLVTERSQVRETRRRLRWQKISEEASRQCGRNRIPLIHEPATFEGIITSQMSGRGIICWEKEGLPFPAALKSCIHEKRILLCIGPEGGFSEKEIQIAADKDFTVASLGRRILRAETAAIASTAIVQYVIGDIGGTS